MLVRRFPAKAVAILAVRHQVHQLSVPNHGSMRARVEFQRPSSKLVGSGKRSRPDACIMQRNCLRLIGVDMTRVLTQVRIAGIVAAFLSLIVVGSGSASAQSGGEVNTLRSSGDPARPVIIPLTIRVKGQVAQSELELQSVDLTVNEDGESQTILSIRAMGTS